MPCSQCMQNFQKTICDRCGMDISQRVGKIYEMLFHLKFTCECCGEEMEMDVCWDCDWDLMNGGDPHADPGEIMLDRWESAYAYDPVNIPPPPGRY